MGDCTANLELCRSTLDDGSLSCAVLLLLLGRWPLVERLVSYGSLSCTVLSTPACNCCINDLHRAAPKRHFAPPGPNGRTDQAVNAFACGGSPHRVSCRLRRPPIGAGLAWLCSNGQTKPDNSMLLHAIHRGAVP